MIKLRFFHNFRLLNAIYDVILITLMVCAPMVLHALEGGHGGGGDSGVTVTIRSADAQRLRELTRLREETGLAAEAVKRLELENESLREEKAELRAELFEIKEKFAKQNANYRQLQLWLAGVPAEGAVRRTAAAGDGGSFKRRQCARPQRRLILRTGAAAFEGAADREGSAGGDPASAGRAFKGCAPLYRLDGIR